MGELATAAKALKVGRTDGEAQPDISATASSTPRATGSDARRMRSAMGSAPA